MTVTKKIYELIPTLNTILDVNLYFLGFISYLIGIRFNTPLKYTHPNMHYI